MTSHLFPAADIGVTALSVAAAIFLCTFVLQAEMKTAPTTMTAATMNETRRGALSTPLFDPPPKDGEG